MSLDAHAVSTGSAMNPFSFHLPTRIHVGEGSLQQVGPLTAGLFVDAAPPAAAAPGRPLPTRPRRALIVTDPGVRAAGIAGVVASSLQGSGFECEWFDRVAPNPKDVDCDAGGEAARRFAAEVIVAVGGGSVLDSAKVIALLQSHPGRVRDYEGRGKVASPVTPLVAVPTTAGTGSEVTRSAVITDTRAKFKFTVKDVRLAPALAVVDPATTYNLPAPLTASTGMDALVHALEAFTCRVANPMSDALAAAAMGLIFPALRVAVAGAPGGKTGLSGQTGRLLGSAASRQARYDMMVGSLLAGVAFSHSDVAAVHCLAEALGGLYDTPHGVANSMLLPSVTAFNAPANPSKHARAAALCGLPVAGLTDAAAAALLVDEIAKLAADIGIPAFGDLPYVNPADFDRLAQASFVNGSTPDNCRPITEADYLALLREAYS